jgi:3-oxoadipate enol-lactonase
MKINANNISINYEVQGSGPWITLIHGASNSLDVWAQQVEVLAQCFSILTYDIRGHGQSDLGTEPATADVLTKDLRCLFEVLGISTSIVLGHSMGAEIVIRFYLNYPNMVDAMVLCNSTMGALLSEQELMQYRKNRDNDRNNNPDNSLDVDSKITRYFSPGLAKHKPEVIERYKDILYSNRNRRSQQERMHRGGIGGDLTNVPSCKLRQVTCPTLIISGLNDTLVRPSIVEPAKKHFNNMRSEIIPTGHLSFWEHPEEFNRLVLDFASDISKGI